MHAAKWFTHTHLASRVVHGSGAIDAISGELSRLGCKRVLIVTSPSVAASPVGQRVAAAVGPLAIGVFDRSRVHIPLDCVSELQDLLGSTRPDALVAVGGGSSMDTAKAAALAFASERPLSALHGGVHPAPDNCVGHAELPHLLTVPTTLTGAERNGAFSIVDDHQKLYFGEAHTRPAVVIQDPDLLAYTPRQVLVGSGMNSIAHSVEAFVSGALSAFARPIHREALRLHAHNLPLAARSAEDTQAHDALLVAACFASGMAGISSGSRSGIIHAMTHAITGASEAPHGAVYGIVIPQGMRFNGAVVPEGLAEVAEALSGQRRSGEAAVEAFVELRSALGLPGRLRDLGIERSALPRMAELTLRHMAAPQNVRPMDSVDMVLGLLSEIY